jgi:hypothetical protein
LWCFLPTCRERIGEAPINNLQEVAQCFKTCKLLVGNKLISISYTLLTNLHKGIHKQLSNFIKGTLARDL